MKIYLTLSTSLLKYTKTLNFILFDYYTHNIFVSEIPQTPLTIIAFFADGITAYSKS